MEEPTWFELPSPYDTQYFEELLDGYIKKNGNPIIIVIMLSVEKYYPVYKTLCYDRSIASQCLLSKTARKFNHSIATNLLKQINSKLGGDLFTLKFGKDLQPRTMLIGIDVCHAGANSIVGFCASINKQLSQYYSEKIS